MSDTDESAALASEIRKSLEPFLQRVGFEEPHPDGHWPDQLLFESDFRRFKARYPRIAAAHDGTAGSCIDLWVKYDERARRLSLVLEGIDIERWLRLNGSEKLANALAGENRTKALDAAIRGLEIYLNTG